MPNLSLPFDLRAFPVSAPHAALSAVGRRDPGFAWTGLGLFVERVMPKR